MAARPPTRPPSPRRRPTDADRGESAPPSAPACAHSVNTNARPSPHGNFARQPRSSLTYSADHIPAPRAAADLLGRAERPPHTISRAHNHPQRAAAHRAALPAKPAPHSTVNRRTTQHTTQLTPARAQQRRRTRAYPTRTRAQHTRVARQRSATHRAHFPSAAAALHSTIDRCTAQYTLRHTLARAQHRRRTRSPTHTLAQHTRAAHHRSAPHRAHLPLAAAASMPHSTSLTRACTLPTTGSRIVRGREEPPEPESRLVALRDPDLDPSGPQADSPVLEVPLGHEQYASR